MFDARMRVDSIRLFIFMHTVSRHALISLKMVNAEDIFVDLSENVVEDKSTPKRKGNKKKTSHTGSHALRRFELFTWWWQNP